jgi:large subunit ribosomal protein L9
MKVILRATYDTLGTTGDIVDVKPGFGRNFLIPQGIAYPNTRFYQRLFDSERKNLVRKDEEARTRADAVAQKGQGTSIEFVVHVSNRGQMFGAVTKADIAERLIENDIKIDKRKIMLPEPIKSLGEHIVKVKPHGAVEFDVNVSVVPDQLQEEVEELSIKQLVEGEGDLSPLERAALLAEKEAELAEGEEAPVTEEEAVEAPEGEAAPVEMIEMVQVARSDDSEEGEKS